MVETKKAEYRFCPNCWEKDSIYSFTPTPSFCSNCGTKMVDWTLTCECGANIRPSFWDTGFLGFRLALQKHCPDCGRPTAKLAKQEAKQLRKKWRGKRAK